MGNQAPWHLEDLDVMESRLNQLRSGIAALLC